MSRTRLALSIIGVIILGIAVIAINIAYVKWLRS